MGFFHHCANIHENFENAEWFQFDRVKKCRHQHDISRRDWVDLSKKTDLKAWNLVKEIATKAGRLRDIVDVSPFFGTSETESFNSLSTFYHPKDVFL
uniref:Uncharacterized protein n=1 Tax=Caenorhabditis japonica TaxID=281687 RepID=A0A8R1I7Y3_CAEJA